MQTMDKTIPERPIDGIPALLVERQLVVCDLDFAEIHFSSAIVDITDLRPGIRYANNKLLLK